MSEIIHKIYIYILNYNFLSINDGQHLLVGSLPSFYHLYVFHYLVLMESQISNSSASPPLGGLSEEILLKILDSLSNKDKLTMCQVSSRFNNLVHSCTRWDLSLFGLDSSSKLSRFSSKVKIIKSLKMDYIIDIDYTGDDQFDPCLDEDDFYKLLKDHPEIKSLNLDNINSQALGYIGHFCTDLKYIRTILSKSGRSDFRVGFNRLETLVLNIEKFDGQGETIWLLIKHILALPKLRILSLAGSALDDEIIGNMETFTKLETLESLSMPDVSGKVASEIIKACTRSLKSIEVDNIKDEDIFLLLDSCPDLRYVRLCDGCNISRIGYSALFRKLGRRLEYIDIVNSDEDNEDHSRFTNQDLEELINSKPTVLRAVYLDLSFKDGISSEGFTKFVKKHGNQFRYLDLQGSQGLDAALLSAVVENCPLLVQQGVWELGDWNIPSGDFGKFLAVCGDHVKVLVVPKTCNNTDLDKVAASCPKLHALDVSKCEQVTDAGLARCLAKCRGLRHLQISDDLITKYETFIRELFPRLRINSFDEIWREFAFCNEFVDYKW